MANLSKELNDLFSQKTFEVHVKASSKNKKLIFEDDKIILFVKSKPENNKANDEIEGYLSKLSGCSAKIIRGKTSKKKLIKLS